ncbi:unnamed protein product [Staurois parvus]|uniref:Uncharacterized protein n=1 Tax=Staurois parvus TaxID=386267 RepID=A0ABN9D5M9_9NEOB|nr:unnamed protein product [Staurois parvus]
MSSMQMIVKQRPWEAGHCYVGHVQNFFFFKYHKEGEVHSFYMTLRMTAKEGRTDHLETRALVEGPGSVGGPMRCPWYLFHRLF